VASIKLRPWPFGNRIVKLHWFGHVRLTKGNRWRITVAFEDNQNIELINYPIGLLPILRIGQYYQNGQALISQATGSIDIAHIRDLSDGHTKNSLDICRRFNYYLYKRAELIKQNIWCFQSKGIYYYIPHIELVRALFAKNKVLANALLRPNGLVYLLDHEHYNNRQAILDFSREIPASLINDDFVQHFSWVYFITEIRNSFESVQTNVYAQAATNYGLAFGQAIEVIVPKLLNSDWVVRGKRINQHVLIYELLSFSASEFPVERIDYSHKSIKRRVYCNNPKKKRISKGKEHTFEIDGEDKNQAREETHQPVVESEATQMVFTNSPEINRIAKYDQQINQGDSYTSKQGRGGAALIAASIDESITGGSVQPIEFKTLEIAYERDGFGLEDFYEMIKCLEEMHQEIILSMNLVNLPLGRKFSWLPDGRRRVCAIVRVKWARGKVNYILEIARPDQRSLSTLIVQFTRTINRENEEKAIHELLLNLVLNSGNWPTEWLRKINHVKLRHTDMEPSHWAERVYEKIR